MEPAKKYQPNIEPDIRPDLRVVKGGGESTPERGNLEVTKDLSSSENNAGRNFGVIDGGGESTPERGNLASVAKEAEQSRQGYWAGRSQTNSNQAQKLSIRGNLKKKGPLGGLIALVIGIPTLISIFLSPALVIQQFAETLTDEFNDQVAAMDMRSTLLLKKKYTTNFTAGVCNPVTIRCKYQSIRENSGLAKRLNNAGVTIEGNKSAIPGRIKPTHFVFEGKRIPASQLLTEAKTNPGLRSALKKGYDPLYAAFSDRKSTDIRTRLGLKRSSSVNSSNSVENMDEDLKKAAAGTDSIPEDGQKLKAVEGKDSEGRTVVVRYEDTYGNSYGVKEGERINSLMDEIIGRNELADSVGKAATKSVLKGTLTATAFGAGAVDSACTVWNMIRIAGYAAKIYQQRQLIRYSYEFVKFAHKQKYGDTTPEETDFFMNKVVTNTNSEGKNALDSEGYRWAAYGDTFTPGDFTDATAGMKEGDDSTKYINNLMLQNEASRYVNGQLVGTSLMAKIAGVVTGSDSSTVAAADKVCDFTKSWEGQAIVFGLAALGAVAAFFTGGASVSIGAVAQGVVSVGMSVAFSLLQPKLIAMAKGEVIQGDENSNEVGNASVSGFGGYNAQTAQARGLGVATQETYTAYSQLSSQVAAKYAEEDRDSRSPFDPSSKNTFIGSILSSITPYVAKMNSVGSTGFSVGSFVSSSLRTLGMTQTTSAATDKYNKCDDPEYDEYNLAADPFCNLRYAIPVEDLEIDPEEVLDYMLAYKTETDPNTGEQRKVYLYLNSPSDETPIGDYATYVEKCFMRINSIGDGKTDTNEGDGEECIIGKGGANEDRNRMFRLFYLDTSTNEGFEEDYDDGELASAAENTGAGTTFTIGSYNQKRDLSSSQHVAAAENIVNSKMDVVGTQETANPKFGRYKSFLSGKNYGVYPSSAGPNRTCSSNQAIFYNKDKFKLVKGGYFEIPRYPDPAANCGNNGEVTTSGHSSSGGLPSVWTNMPVAYLEDVETGQSVIVISAHNVANVSGAAGTTPAKSRFESAKIYVSQIKQLQTQNPGVPIFLVGDFNEGTNVRTSANVTWQGKQDNLLFCMFAENGLMKSIAGPAMKCDPSYSIGGVDYLYATTGVEVDWVKEIASGGASHSDHPVKYAKVTVPGSKDTVATGSNIQGDDYAKECGRYLSSGDCTGECVGFVKFRLVKHGVIQPRSLGNGGSVTATLRGLGFTVNTTPAVNSVMSLRHNSVGHTAMVSKVNSDGSIVVEEYNWSVDHGYGTRIISASKLDSYRNQGIISFAHTEVKYK